MMDVLEYINFFKDLVEIIEKISGNSIKQEFRKDIIPVTDKIINNTVEILLYCKKNAYILSIEVIMEFQQNLYSNHRVLNELIKKLKIFKKCSKCNTKLPATKQFFHKDSRTKDRLRPDCKRCHCKKQKEIYERNKNAH